jgi:hypothetical protein
MQGDEAKREPEKIGREKNNRVNTQMFVTPNRKT